MKVAIYYPWIYLTSGVERMILELVKRSSHEWTIFTSHYYPEQTYPELQDLDIVELAPISVSRKYSAVGSAAVTILKQKINLNNYDALVVSSEGLGDLITFRNHSLPVICYCHTPMKVIHDPFTRQRYLQTHKLMTPAFFFYSAFFHSIDKRAWKHYQYIFCNSEEVRTRIIGAGLATSEKIEVLHPGIDTSIMVPGQEYQKYFLVAGRIKWFKNVELAIDSFLNFKHRYPEFSDFGLRISGRVEPRSNHYLNGLQERAGWANVVFDCNPSDEDLFDAYRRCYALIYPSLNEDWGMVPLEAMGFGKPVISVNRGGPTESVIDGVTGFLLEPDPEIFADKMAQLAGDQVLTRQLGNAATEHVKKYDWHYFVERFDSFLDSL